VRISFGTAAAVIPTAKADDNTVEARLIDRQDADEAGTVLHYVFEVGPDVDTYGMSDVGIRPQNAEQDHRGGEMRRYSAAGQQADPQHRGHGVPHTVALCVRRVPNGAVSDNILSKLPIGRTIQISLPLRSQFPPPNPDDDILIAVNGTGIAFVRALAQALASNPDCRMKSISRTGKN
jgi:hypothetical protein